MSPIFKKKQIVTHETLGERFRKVRLGKSWTLEVASQQTKISQRHLEALEKAAYDLIPGEVYITNFIRVYSKTLGLQPKRCLEKYQLERHIIEQKKHHWFLKEIGEGTLFEFLLKPRTIKLAAICAIVFVVLSYIVLNIYQTIAPPSLTIYYPLYDTETTDHIIYVRGKTDPQAHITINNEDVLLEENGTFAEEVTLRDGLNLIEIKARRQHGMEKKILRHILVNDGRELSSNK